MFNIINKFIFIHFLLGSAGEGVRQEPAVRADHGDVQGQEEGGFVRGTGQEAEEEEAEEAEEEGQAIEYVPLISNV